MRLDRDGGGRRAHCWNEAGAAIDPERLAGTLSMPEQQMVEIAKAIGADAKIVIMDEPTASLMDARSNACSASSACCARRGGGIIYISHRLEEVFAVSDRVTVLRDGETIATCDTAAIDRPALIQMMVGRALTEVVSRSGRSPRARSCSSCATCRTGRWASTTSRCS